MKTSDGDLKVNRNIYPDAITCDRMRLIGSKQPLRICKDNKSKINCESTIGQQLIANPECAKTYKDDNFRIIGQARSSFHLSVFEFVYIKSQNPVLCRQKEFVFSPGPFK